jgi:hypothetical protein
MAKDSKTTPSRPPRGEELREGIFGVCVEHGEGMKLILEVGLGRFESYRSDN